MPLSETLTDRQAAAAVRGRMDWQYAVGLALTDTGVDFSVLRALRTRLLAGAVEGRLLTTMLNCFTARGLRKSRGKPRTDATPSVAAVWALNRFAMGGETLHVALSGSGARRAWEDVGQVCPQAGKAGCIRLCDYNLRDHDRLIDSLWTIGIGPEHLAAPPRYTTVHKTLRGCGSHHNPLVFRAGPTRLELATSGVTGRRSNQLNYDPRTT